MYKCRLPRLGEHYTTSGISYIIHIVRYKDHPKGSPVPPGIKKPGPCYGNHELGVLFKLPLLIMIYNEPGMGAIAPEVQKKKLNGEIKEFTFNYRG